MVIQPVFEIHYFIHGLWKYFSFSLIGVIPLEAFAFQKER